MKIKSAYFKEKIPDWTECFRLFECTQGNETWYEVERKTWLGWWPVAYEGKLKIKVKWDAERLIENKMVKIRKKRQKSFKIKRIQL